MELLAELPGVFVRPAVESLESPGLEPAAGMELSVPDVGSEDPLVEGSEGSAPPVEGRLESRLEAEPRDRLGSVPLNDPAARESEPAPVVGLLEPPEGGIPDKPEMPVGEFAPREDVLLE